MSYFEILLLSLALSVDACAVSFSYGLAFGDNKKTAMQLALFTGVFQGIMPIIGYFLTSIVKAYILPYASFIVFFIFLILGIKIILEAFEQKKEKQLCLDFCCLILIGIATSIDAFSAGISLLLSGNLIIKPALLIFLVTFINSYIGFYAGSNIKSIPKKQLQIMAGITLIILGFKSFY